MNTIKWETVKRKCIEAKCLSKDAVTQCRFISSKDSSFYLSLLEAVGMNKKPKEVLENWMEEAVKIIDNWDIRSARKLIELCSTNELAPGYVDSGHALFRGYHKNCKITATYDEKGEWILIFE